MSGKKEKDAAAAAAVATLPTASQQDLAGHPAIRTMIEEATASAMASFRRDLDQQASQMVDGIASAIAGAVAPLAKQINEAAGKEIAVAPSAATTKAWYGGLSDKEKHEVNRAMGLMKSPSGLWTAALGHDFELMKHGGWGIAAGGLNILGKAGLPLAVWKLLQLLSVL